MFLAGEILKLVRAHPLGQRDVSYPADPDTEPVSKQAHTSIILRRRASNKSTVAAMVTFRLSTPVVWNLQAPGYRPELIADATPFCSNHKCETPC